MFQEAKAIDVTDKEITITPLDYALRVNDIFTLTIFKKYASAMDSEKMDELIKLLPESLCTDTPASDEIKKQYALVRGTSPHDFNENPCQARAEILPCAYDKIATDALVFRHLAEVRHHQIKQLAYPFLNCVML
jgi:hypothetical protein